MANQTNISKSDGGGICTRYSAVIYDQYKTHGSNFFLMLANNIAKYEDSANIADNSDKQGKEDVPEQHRYKADERTKQAQHLGHDHWESWRKFLDFFGSNVKLSNAIAKKYIKWGKRYAMERKYITKIIKRRGSDLYFAYNVAKSDQTKRHGDKTVALLEREWFATQFSRQMGAAPELIDEVIVLESLMKKVKWRYVRASKYFTNKIVQDPKTVTTLTWGSAPRMVKCMCPVQDCICLGNTLLPPQSIPRGSYVYYFPWLWRTINIMQFTRRDPPKDTLVPALIQSAIIEQKLYILFEERNLLEKLGPEMCLYGCRNFFFYDRTSYSIARAQQKNVLKQAIIDGTDSPLRVDTVLERLREEDPRTGETAESEGNLDDSQSIEEEQDEELKEVWLLSDRICDNRGQCCVSSQVERGADGEFEISFPYDIKFPRIVKNISETSLDVYSIYSMKRRWYDKWRKEFYLSVFRYPEKERVFSLETKETQTDERLKSCLVITLKDTTDETQQKEKVDSTCGVIPKLVKCRCYATPEERSRTSNVTCVASQHSLQKSNRTPSGTSHQIPKSGAKTKPTPSLTADAAPKSSKTISQDKVQKRLTTKDSLILKNNDKRSTEKLSRVPKKCWTPTSSAPHNFTTRYTEAPARPQKAGSLDAGPKRVKRGFFSRSTKSVETKKESKTDKVSKASNETIRAKIVKSVLRSLNVVTVNTSDKSIEKQSHDESSREQIIKEILLEPQTFP